MRKDDCPVKHTCSDIDGAKDVINSICDKLKVGVENITQDDIDNVIYDLERIGIIRNCILEELRRSNSSLRDWGHEMSERSDSFEEELEEAKDENEKLTSNNLDLNEELKELIDQVEELEYKLKQE